MCGICGIIGAREEERLQKMNQAITHRGPDQEGYYFNDTISLGNKRLSIIDLNTGDQPIYNEDKSMVIVFNGEIYNFKNLKTELLSKGHKFYTETDTEVIIHAYEEFGTDCLQKFNGDFAFALYDIKNNEVFIARDRLGIRPVYYYNVDNKILFASELKALLASGMVKKEINLQSIDKYLTLRYCWGTDTFFEGIKKLPAASYMFIRNNNTTIQKYWNIDYTPVKYPSHTDYIEKFTELFERSVQLRMIADVPFGAFLSGGIDSSLIVAMMSRHSKMPIETFSLGFGLDLDETSDARQMAEYFGCNHHEIMMDKQSYDLLPEIVRYFDEPLGDSIVIPTYLLNKEAAKNIKVVLTGEGADEIFGAYVHQFTMHYGSLYNKLIPGFLQDKVFLPAIKNAPLEMLDKIFPYPSSLGKKGKEKLLKYMSHLKRLDDAYFAIASVFSEADKDKFYTPHLKDRLVSHNYFTEFSSHLEHNSKLPVLNQLIDLDTKYWLADYTLYKQDRLTMANSIEGRIPYLDHNLVEFVASIPLNYKINGLNTKYLLRKVAKSYLPGSTAFKAKKAFYFPYTQFFGKDFVAYLNDLFSQNSFIIKMDLINRNELKQLIHDSSNTDLTTSKQLMSLIILEHWLRIYA
jgi:asparagine synthase (glutamine-hydrolysing)